MKPFLVRGTVRESPYMNDATHFEDMRLVMAHDAEEAKAKFEAWWENKSSPYSVSYYVSGEVVETIE